MLMMKLAETPDGPDPTQYSRNGSGIPTIMWPNGRYDEAGTWDELLENIRMSQWSDMNEQEFRRTMARRAAIWSSTIIMVNCTAARFIRELERAGILIVLGGQEVSE